MSDEIVSYQGDEYSISKDDNSDKFLCKSTHNEFLISAEELAILKQVTSQSDIVPNENELVSFYNDMIKFNPYQYKPYFRLISKENEKNCIYIADEVGVGKTFETGIIISELLFSDKISINDSILIVCPNMLCRKWQEVLNMYFGLSSKIIRNLARMSGGISIISFHSLSQSAKDEIFGSTKLGILIIDEVHNAGKRYNKLLELRNKSTFAILLSATPLSGKDNSEFIQKKLLFGIENDVENLFRYESPYFNRTLKEEMRQEKVKWHIENCRIKNKSLERYVDIIKDIYSGKNTLKKFVGLNMISSSPAAAKAYCEYLMKIEPGKVKELFLSSKLVKEDSTCFK